MAKKTEKRQSMNRAGGRCHDNARCESMWARMKSELFYDHLNPECLTVEELKTFVWRYFTFSIFATARRTVSILQWVSS